MLTHLSALLSYVLPFGSIIGPLIAWSVKKEQSAFVDENGKSAVNFNITWTLLLVALWTAWLMNFFGQFYGLIIDLSQHSGSLESTPIVNLFGALLLFIPIGAVYLFKFILMVVATVRASSGEVFHYPLTYHFIK